jgi:hypothetical protein
MGLIVTSAFANRAMSTDRQQSANDALARITSTQLWDEAVIYRGSLAVGRKLVRPVADGGEMAATTAQS